MRRVTRNGVIAVAAASGAMAVTMPAYAGAAADGAATGSPGLISGNAVQLPLHVPVNVCGNTVDVVGLLNPAAGNTCVNEGSGEGRSARATGAGSKGGGATNDSGATARGEAGDSAGVLSGNGVRLPVHLPLNVSGNSVNVVGIGNASDGNTSVNGPGERPEEPDRPTTPTPSTPPKRTPPPRPAAPHTPPGESLARTGADQTLPAAVGSAALVLGGVVLYRRSRAVR